MTKDRVLVTLSVLGDVGDVMSPSGTLRAAEGGQYLLTYPTQVVVKKDFRKRQRDVIDAVGAVLGWANADGAFSPTAPKAADAPKQDAILQKQGTGHSRWSLRTDLLRLQCRVPLRNVPIYC